MDNFHGARRALGSMGTETAQGAPTKEETVRGIERGPGVEPVGARADGRPRPGGVPVSPDPMRNRSWSRSRIWVDPRFLVGVMLVVASIAGVWWLVTTSSRTVPVYAASETLTPGTPLDRSSLRVIDTRLGAVEEGYLGAQGDPPDDAVVTRTIAAGELVPLAALGEADAVGVTTLVVEPAGRLSADIVRGTVVDLWAAAPEGDGYGVPEVLVSAATVVRASEEEGFLARGGSVALELAVPRSAVATVLASTAAAHLLSVVPTEPGGH